MTGAGAPLFTASNVYNALGYQTKLAPGAVFVIFGSSMGPSSLAAATGPGYPDNVGGTSITFTPTGGNRSPRRCCTRWQDRWPVYCLRRSLRGPMRSA